MGVPFSGCRFLVAVPFSGRGFEHKGEVCRTLSAVAGAVTGTHWNGYQFFNLKPGKNGVADD